FNKDNIKLSIIFGFTILISLAVAGYYLVPLLLETKYLVYGQGSAKSTYQFLDWKNFSSPYWHYFYQNDILRRGHFIKTGVVEFLSLFLGLGAVIYKVMIKKDRTITVLEYAVVTGVIITFLLTQFSSVFYKHIFILAAVQFPWRMLSAFIFIPPIIIAYLCKDLKNNLLVVCLMILFAFQYLPQLYGKNYTVHTSMDYLFTTKNLYSEANTLWIGKPEDYPIKKQKFDIVDGNGMVTSSEIHNSSRSYMVSAENPIRMVDYTFYFPGWKVYVDKQPVEIEYQDPNYRGVITYRVPSGKHSVKVVLEDTKIRLLAKLISLVALITLPIFLSLLRKKSRYNTV
ncbi:MAG: hypothetical protein ABIO02_04075, partial [Patescibacteria group bacterium]